MAKYELIFENVEIDNTLSLQGQNQAGKLNFKDCNINILSLENFNDYDINVITFNNCNINVLTFPEYYIVNGSITQLRNFEFNKLDNNTIKINLEGTSITSEEEQNYIKENIFPIAYANGNLSLPDNS